MIGKLALAAATTFALTPPALAAARGVPDRQECTHCLPSVVTGGPVMVRGRTIERESPRIAVRVAGDGSAARKGVPQRADGERRAVVRADCTCVTGSCPAHR